MGKMSSLWVEIGNCAKTDPVYIGCELFIVSMDWSFP